MPPSHTVRYDRPPWPWLPSVADAADIESAVQELRKRGVKINAFGVTYQTIRIADFQAMSRFSGDLCVHSG